MPEPAGRGVGRPPQPPVRVSRSAETARTAGNSERAASRDELHLRTDLPMDFPFEVSGAAVLTDCRITRPHLCPPRGVCHPLDSVSRFPTRSPLRGALESAALGSATKKRTRQARSPVRTAVLLDRRGPLTRPTPAMHPVRCLLSASGETSVEPDPPGKSAGHPQVGASNRAAARRPAGMACRPRRVMSGPAGRRSTAGEQPAAELTSGPSGRQSTAGTRRRGRGRAAVRPQSAAGMAHRPGDGPFLPWRIDP